MKSQYNLLLYILVFVSVVSFSILIFYLILAKKLFVEFGWKIYKKIGADSKLIGKFALILEMYKYHQILMLFLRLDVYFFVGYFVQYVALILSPKDYEFYLTMACVPFLLFTIFISIYGLERENKYTTIYLILISSLSTVYFIFKLIRFEEPNLNEVFHKTRSYLTFFGNFSFILLASISLSCILVTIVMAFLNLRNFGKGLKEKIEQQNTFIEKRPLSL